MSLGAILDLLVTALQSNEAEFVALVGKGEGVIGPFVSKLFSEIEAKVPGGLIGLIAKPVVDAIAAAVEAFVASAQQTYSAQEIYSFLLAFLQSLAKANGG